MDIVQLRTEVIDFVKKASELEDQEKYEEARRLYNKAVDNLKYMIKNDGNKYNIETYEAKLKDYEERSLYLKELVTKIENNKKVPIGGDK